MMPLPVLFLMNHYNGVHVRIICLFSHFSNVSFIYTLYNLHMNTYTSIWMYQNYQITLKCAYIVPQQIQLTCAQCSLICSTSFQIAATKACITFTNGSKSLWNKSWLQFQYKLFIYTSAISEMITFIYLEKFIKNVFYITEIIFLNSTAMVIYL